jgi:hypothetical protein
MKELNETQLHGWRPRRPSRALKDRIFASRSDSPSQEADEPVAWKWSFSAPAMICLLFAMLMFHFNSGVLHEQKPAMAMISSNGDRLANFSDQAQETENHMASITFDWTNHTGFKSSIGFTPTTNFSN